MSDSIWMETIAGTPYELTVSDEDIRISYSEPPEYHYRLSDNCSLQEFVTGGIHSPVRSLFGEQILQQALTEARRRLKP